ncbi:MAG: TraK family protein [Pseudomonadota bacterium]
MPKKKSLVDKIKARRVQHESLRNKGVVAVLAQKEEISDALSHGFTMREIHTVLADEGKMPVRYNAFTRLVNIYIKGKEHPKTPKVSTENKETTDKKKSHIFNPDDYDKKDLF